VSYDLALRFSQTGRFEDVLSEVCDFPLLSIGGWLLDDLRVPDDDQGDAARRRLFVAAVFSLASVHTLDQMHDDSTFYDRPHAALAQLLWERTTSQFAEMISFHQAFWDQHRTIWTDHLEASLRQHEHDRTRVASDSDGDRRHFTRWSAPARVLAAAATALAQRDADLPQIVNLLDELAVALALREELAAIPRDLRSGRVSYPIAMLARAAGITGPPRAAEILPAMVLTNALGTICDEARSSAAVARRLAGDLELGTIASFVDDVDRMLIEMTKGLLTPRSRDAGVARSGGSSAGMPRLELDDPPLDKAIQMAEAFLLSDRTFKESWEVHREGMFGAPEVTSRFPVALILEILCAHGHDLAQQIDELRHHFELNGFRYYDHATSAMDTDTLGAFLRLETYARRSTGPDGLLEAALACLDRAVQKTGSVPVWIPDCDELSDGPRPPGLYLGEGCATVEAHLLIGLTEFAFEVYRSVIELAASRLCERLLRVGLAANVNYPGLHAIGVFFRLATCLEREDLTAGLRGQLLEVRRALLPELESATARAVVTPQDAALLVLACLHAGEPRLLRSRWISVMLKQQRHDGSWAAEPFAATPNRGGSVTWYGTKTLTTALCYDALKRSTQRTRQATA
jgi:hypothetical protein